MPSSAVIVPKLPDSDDQGDEDYLLEDAHLGDEPVSEGAEENEGPYPVDHEVTVTHLRCDYKPF